MEFSYLIIKESWDKVLSAIIRDFILYAPIAGNDYQDYLAIDEDSIDHCVFNSSKPTTLFKSLFLPGKILLSIPSSGSGRCIEACIGSINKNDLFHEHISTPSGKAG